MQVNTPETFEIAANRYREILNLHRKLGWVFLIGYIGFAATVVFASRLPSVGWLDFSIWGFVASALLVLALVSLLFRRRYSRLANEAIPSIEGRTLCFLQEAVKNLGVFIQQRSESFRKASLEDLREAAELIDEWTIGNLQFIEKSFGQKVQDFKGGFRFRLIPAVQTAKADSKIAHDIHQFISISAQNQLLSGMDGARLDSWNTFLGNFDEVKPKRGMFRQLLSKNAMYHGGYLVAVFIIAFGYWELQRSVLGADANTSTTGLGIVLGIFLTPYVAFLFWKYIYRGKQ